MEIMKAKRSWSRVIQTLTDHGCQPRVLYPAKLSIIIDRQNKIFHDRTRFNQYLATNSALKKVQERKLQPKEVSYINKNTSNRWSHSSEFQRREKHTITSPTMKTKIPKTTNHWSLISLNINGLNSPIKKKQTTG